MGCGRLPRSKTCASLTYRTSGLLLLKSSSSCETPAVDCRTSGGVTRQWSGNRQWWPTEIGGYATARGDEATVVGGSSALAGSRQRWTQFAGQGPCSRIPSCDRCREAGVSLLDILWVVSQGRGTGSAVWVLYVQQRQVVPVHAIQRAIRRLGCPGRMLAGALHCRAFNLLDKALQYAGAVFWGDHVVKGCSRQTMIYKP